MISFPSLPPIGELELDDPFWRYPSGAGAGEGVARLRVWAASGGTGHLAVVTELGLGASITNSIEDIWDTLRARWHGDLILIGHYPAAESFPDDGDYLDQVVIGPGREPEWRRVWPIPASSPDRGWLTGWMSRHGHRITADATSAMTSMGFAQLMAAGTRARAFPTVYPGGAGAVIREAVTALWPQVTPAAVADVLCACTDWIIVRQGKSADILDGWGSCPVAAAMLKTATMTADGRYAVARTLIDTEREQDLLIGTSVLLALAHQRSDEDLTADAEGGEDDDWDDTCEECGGDLQGKGTYGCECWNPMACDECGDPNGDCDCSDF